MLPQELNFKAFLKKENKLVKIQSIDFITNKVTYSLNIFDDKEQVACYKSFEANFNEIELIQCTNQKDKNGNFIYEGDIVRTFESLVGIIRYGKHANVTKNPINLGWYIEWKDYSNSLIFSNQLLAFSELANNPSGLEVIGNIYENKESLCQKQ